MTASHGTGQTVLTYAVPAFAWLTLSAQKSASSIFQEFIDEALQIIEAANKIEIPLRLIGALGIYHHCPASSIFRFCDWRMSL